MNTRTSLLALIALVAIAAGVFFFIGARSDTIIYQGYSIPQDQLRIVDPHPGCDEIHYHAAASKSAQTTDGTVLPDETDCGFGPVQ